MANLQTPGAGRDRPNHSFSPNAPSFIPSSRGRGGGSNSRRNGTPQTDSLLVAELYRETLNHMFIAKQTKITDFEHLASYNWLDARHPTIAVPGAPSLLDAPSIPVQVKPDQGKHFVDQNGARSPNSPLEPLFRSLFALKPGFDMSAVDLVSDRNNIRKLLKFVTSQSRGSSTRDKFEIKVELAGGKTLLFTRVEPKSVRWSNGTDNNYGHNFEAAITKDHIGKSHHRIVSYDLGGLRMISRFECDGYLTPEIESQAFPSSMAFGTDPHTTSSQPRTNPARSAQPAQTPGMLSDLLNGLSIETPSPTSKPSLASSRWADPSTVVTNTTRYIPPAQRTIEVKSQGSPVPASQTVEIKTRAASKGLEYNTILTQMWVSQTPHLVAGYFRPGGYFVQIDCEDMTSKILEWEKNNEASLQRLVALIRWIRDNVQNIEGMRGTVRFGGGDNIKIMGPEPETNVSGKGNAQHNAATRRKALPDDLYEKWGSTGLGAQARGPASERELGGRISDSARLA